LYFGRLEIIKSISPLLSLIGKIPFLKQLLKKISAKLIANITFIPKSLIAHGACSLDDPQPKFSKAINILESEKGFSFNMKFLLRFPFSSYHIS